MAQKNIDFGSFPDDPSADAIRTAFAKTQDNFDELFSGLQDQAVVSINKTPGPGITVNSPTGNVVITANISCVQVSTSTLSIGRDANGSNATSITSSSQTLVIDLPSTINNVANVNLTNTLTSNSVNVNLQLTGNVGVFSGNLTAANLITGGSLSVVGNATAGNIGAGNATFVANVSASNISATTANVSGNTSTGNITVANQANVNGNLNVTGNVTTSNYFVGNGYYLTDVIAAPGPKIVNGASYTNIATVNGEIVSVVNGYNIHTLTASGANVNGYITLTGNLTAANANLGNAVNANYFIGNLYGTANSATNANSATIAGTVTTNAQPNITSVGTLSSLSVTGNVTAGNFVGTLANGNSSISIPAANGNINISASGSPNELVITSTGVNVTGALNATGNANVGNLGTTRVIATGNISGTQLISNIATGTAPLVVSSTTQVANLNAATAGEATNAVAVLTNTSTNTIVYLTGTQSSANGNVSLEKVTGIYANMSNNSITATTFVGSLSGAATSATTAGTVTTNAQPNITSVGTLTSLSVSGNTVSGNVYANSGTIRASILTGTLTTASQPNITSVGTLGSLTVTNKITAGQLQGEGGNISNVQAGNIIGTVANATYAISAGTAGSATTSGTVTNNAQPNITSVGTLSSLSVTGTVTSGNVSGGNLVSANYISGTLTTNAQPNITSLGTLSWVNVQGTVTAVSFIANTGTFTGNGSGLTNIVGSNVTGQVGNALVASAVYTNAQPNITSVGTLTSLSVSGNITSGNIDGGNLIKANYIQGDGSLLSNISVGAGSYIENGNSEVRIDANSNVRVTVAGSANVLVVSGTGANITGTANISGNLTAGNVSATLLTGTLTTSAQPNITSLGTLTGLNVTGTANLSAVGNVKISGGSNNQVLVATGSGSDLAFVTATGLTFAPGTNTQVLFNDAGNFAANANLTFNKTTGTLGAQALTVTSNATFGNVFANSGTIRGNLLTGTLTTAAQPNITSVGSLTGLIVNGNINAGNISGGNAVSANFFIGSAANLTSIPGANVVGTVANAVAANTSLANVSTATLVYPTFVTSSANGYFSGVFNTGISANLSNNSITATTFIGALSGAATSATTAGTVTTNSQPNITSVGSLTSLIVNGNINSGNITGGNAISSNHYLGRHVYLTDTTTIFDPAANINQTWNNANVAFTMIRGNVTDTASNANSLLIDLLVADSSRFSVNKVGNVAFSGVITGNGSGLSAIAGSNVTGAVAFATAANSVAGANVTGQVGNALVAGTVYIAAQSNITSVGTLTSLAVSGNITAQANVNMSAGYVIRSVNAAVSAAGTNQGTATAITREMNVVSTVATGAGVILPTAVAGMAITLINTSANTLLVYPHVGGDINGGVTNAAFVQPAGATLQFVAPNTTDWYTVGATFA